MKNLPKYQCHKVVGAVQISAIDHKPNPDVIGNSSASSYGAIITPKHSTLHAFEVSDDYMIKHKPQVGGYYVVYEDGYASYSPAEEFESTYTLVDSNQPDVSNLRLFSISVDGEMTDEAAIEVLKTHIDNLKSGKSSIDDVFTLVKAA
jgi:hypothetical protein